MNTKQILTSAHKRVTAAKLAPAHEAMAAAVVASFRANYVEVKVESVSLDADGVGAMTVRYKDPISGQLEEFDFDIEKTGVTFNSSSSTVFREFDTVSRVNAKTPVIAQSDAKGLKTWAREVELNINARKKVLTDVEEFVSGFVGAVEASIKLITKTLKATNRRER